MNFAGTMKPYRIGWSKHGRKWWRMGADRWQSECPDVCRYARRGRTPEAALRRMERDVAAALQGGQTVHQRWKKWRSRKWDAANLPVQHSDGADRAGVAGLSDRQRESGVAAPDSPPAPTDGSPALTEDGQ